MERNSLFGETAEVERVPSRRVVGRHAPHFNKARVLTTLPEEGVHLSFQSLKNELLLLLVIQFRDE